jgi:SAM-dependent methyltransferase/protein tyrosine phosphatase (PTP) superfamily phosphohydrolase (DUF442 family)
LVATSDSRAVISSIPNLHEASATVMTSAQPSESQLSDIAAAGYEVVINLGLHDDKCYALADEPGTVAALGMRYEHIPVPFAAPTRALLDDFFAAMRKHEGRKRWVHCAANWRVSAFIGLWRVLEQGWPRATAFDILRAVANERWAPDATWQAFIDAQLEGAAAVKPQREGSVDAMADYYAQRAAIYERVYHKPERQADLRAIEAWLPAVFANRRVLEVACGTGWWTPHAARDCTHWLATDLEPATMAIARTKTMPRDARGCSKIDFAIADAYDLASTLGTRRPGASIEHRFDAGFTGCWWSHVPLPRLRPWLDQFHAVLEPGARVVMLDNAFVQTSNHPIHRRDTDGNTYQLRTLDDGTTHEVVKNFPTRAEAIDALGPRARDAHWWQPACGGEAACLEHYWVLSYTLA